MRFPAILMILAAIGCSSASTPPADAGAAPDFALQDVNPTSPTFTANVSPRDQRGRVSAWYFGSAT